MAVAGRKLVFTGGLSLLLLMLVENSAAKKCGVVCRVKDPLTIGNSHVLKECLYEVYPVEATQNAGERGVDSGSGSRNRLFALYGGPNSCQYFGSMIQTVKGRETLVETIHKQLEKSGFRGLDLQCDAGQAQVSQHVYGQFIEQLRSHLGSTYIIMVTMSNVFLEPALIECLNRGVDFVTFNHVGQTVSLQGVLSFGLDRHRILLQAPFPSVIQCPLDASNAISDVLNQVENHNLFGATVQLDLDDIDNMCGEGPFPLFRKVLERLCTDAECNFNGFIRDTRDCSRFYSCCNGQKNTHQCPSGQSFDLCTSSCQPFLKVDCNGTSCVLRGAFPPGQFPVPIPVPCGFPNPFFPLNCSCGGNNGSGGGDNGGGNHGNSNSSCCCDVIANLTAILNNTAQFSEFLKLLKDTDLEGLFAIFNRLTVDIQPLLARLIGAVNQFLEKVLLGGVLLNNTTHGLTTMHGHIHKFDGIIELLLKLVENLLGTDNSGLLPGLALLGGGGAHGHAPTSPIGAVAPPLAPALSLAGTAKAAASPSKLASAGSVTGTLGL